MRIITQIFSSSVFQINIAYGLKGNTDYAEDLEIRIARKKDLYILRNPTLDKYQAYQNVLWRGSKNPFGENCSHQ